MRRARVEAAVPDVRLFVREPCGLCEQALATVEREMSRFLGPPRLRFSPATCGPSSIVRRVEYSDGSVLQVIDVDAEPSLSAKFGFEVPVVEIAGGPSFALVVEARDFSFALRGGSEGVGA
jgi:hypothetical protein